jgi:hypothetical protein
VSDPKDVNPFPETDHEAPKDLPPLTVMSLSTRTVVNHKENKREIVCATARIWSNSESVPPSPVYFWDPSSYATIVTCILTGAPLHHTSDRITGCLGISSPYRRFHPTGIAPLLCSHVRTAARPVPSKLRIQGQSELERLYLTSEERTIFIELFVRYVLVLSRSSWMQTDRDGYHRSSDTLSHHVSPPLFP